MENNINLGLLLIIFSIVMICVLTITYLFLIKNQFTKRIIIDLVFFISYYKILAYYLMPSILGIFSNFKFLKEDNISSTDILQVYLIELVSWISWSLGFVLISILIKKNKFTIIEEINVKKQKYLALIITCSYLIFWILSFGGQISGQESTLPWYFEITKTLISSSGPTCSALLLVLGFKKWEKKFAIWGFLIFLFSLFILSTRGAIIYSFIIIFFFFYNLVSSIKTILVGLSFALVFVSIFLFFGGLPQPQISTIGNEISINFEIDKEKKFDKTALEELEWRFGASTRFSSAFIWMYNRGDDAGLNPIINSLKGILPRSINPDKPIPSTKISDDIYSQGMYLIYREIYGYNTYSMVEFSTGCHAYWELGWFGVLFLPVFSGVYVAISSYYFQKFGILSLAFVIAIFKPWGFVDPKIWVSEIILQVYQIIIPLVVISFIIKYSKFKFK